MRKRILMSIILILITTLVYATQRTVLGKNWVVKEGKLQTILDVAILGITYTNQIKPHYGTDEVKIDDLKVDNIKIDNVIGDLIKIDDIEINDSIKLSCFAGGGNRTIMVDNDGNLYVE